MAAALEPRPEASGICERTEKATRPAGWIASNARTQRFVRSSGTSATSDMTEKDPRSCAHSSRCSSSAAARQSYPGPRLADEAGTRTTQLRPADPALPGGSALIGRPSLGEHRLLDAPDLGLAGDDAAG